MSRPTPAQAMTANPWNASAETYRTDAERISFYQVTNRELVAAAGLQAGMAIVDLACGAGLTTRAVLAVLGRACTVWAVDRAAEMLRQARAAIASPGVRFVHASAGDFAGYVPAPIDRVLCNAAFWHFADPDAVLHEVRRVLEASGRFLFNIPDQEFDFGDGTRSEMAQVVASCLGRPLGEAAPRYSHSSIQALAAANAFRIAGFSVVRVPLQPEDVIRFYSIPHVGARRFPDKTVDERRRLFTEAFRGVQWRVAA